MPQHIMPSKIIHQHLTTNTVGGEVTINLNLTITINQDGTMALATTAMPQSQEKEIPNIVPEFETTDLLTNFG